MLLVLTVKIFYTDIQDSMTSGQLSWANKHKS